MSGLAAENLIVETDVGLVTGLNPAELIQLARAAEAAIAGNRANWTRSPGEDALVNYWRGTILAPHRDLFVAKLDRNIVGAVQLIYPGALAETGAFSAELATFFVTPHARGHSLARRLVEAAERQARDKGYKNLDFSVRADREAANGLAKTLGFQRWAVKANYAWVDGVPVSGYFYTKMLGDVSA